METRNTVCSFACVRACGFIYILYYTDIFVLYLIEQMWFYFYFYFLLLVKIK